MNSPAERHRMITQGRWTGPTTSVLDGYQQSILAVVAAYLVSDCSVLRRMLRLINVWLRCCLTQRCSARSSSNSLPVASRCRVISAAARSGSRSRTAASTSACPSMLDFLRNW